MSTFKKPTDPVRLLSRLNGKHSPPPETETSQIFPTTDTGNAERLVAHHGKDLRYIHAHKTWMVWIGTHWARDESGRVDQLAKATARTIPTEASAESLSKEEWAKYLKWAWTSESARGRANMTELARSEDGIPALPEDFDADPWLFNVTNGTIDLRTGELRPHDRADLISKIAPVVYDPNATCPQFLAWLQQIMLDRSDLVTFLQRAAGYSLTGKVSERVVFILHGGGRNGKTTLLETKAGILGDYAGTAPSEMLLSKRESGIPNDVARLPGTRFVSATETGEGRRLDEVKIKSLSGGDTIQARFMRGEWFDFKPEFKLWFGTNHKPEIRGTDNAIWDRIRLIPFDYRVPDDQRIGDLKDTFLATEAPGILAWMVNGCLAWQREGLNLPKEVLEATAQYRAEMDSLSDWISECCELLLDVSEPAKTLYTSYSSYCESVGETPLKQRTFGTRLTERGFGEKRTRQARLRTGIHLKDPNRPNQTTFDEDYVTERDVTSSNASPEKPHDSGDFQKHEAARDVSDTKSDINSSKNTLRGTMPKQTSHTSHTSHNGSHEPKIVVCGGCNLPSPTDARPCPSCGETARHTVAVGGVA